MIGTEREQQPVDAGASAVAQGQPHAGHRERTIVVPEMLRLVGRRAVVLNEEQEVEIRVLQCQQASSRKPKSPERSIDCSAGQSRA